MEALSATAPPVFWGGYYVQSFSKGYLKGTAEGPLGARRGKLSQGNEDRPLMSVVIYRVPNKVYLKSREQNKPPD